MKGKSIRGSLGLGLAGLVASPAGTQTYTVVNLGTIGGAGSSVANGISENGIVVGQSNGQAYKWTMGGGIVGLNGLGGATTNAYSVNSNGQIAGRADLGGGGFHAVLWDNSLNATDLGGTFSEARGINEAGTVVGTSNSRGFRKTYGGAMVELPTLDNITISTAVNTGGTVTGGSDDAGSNRHAYRWNGEPDLEDLGIPIGDSASQGQAINDSNLVVGYSTKFSTFGAFKYDTDFTVLNGLFNYDNRAHGVNNDGDAVGHSWLSDDGSVDSRAVIWHAGTTNAVNLNDLIPGFDGWVLERAADINDAGQIVGTGKFNGQTRAFLLNPVPEPATMAALGLGALALMRRRRS